MSAETAEARVARYERHAIRTRELAGAREAVIEAAKADVNAIGSSSTWVALQCAVRALEKLENNG